jgi:hypothetical protein
MMILRVVASNKPGMGMFDSSGKIASRKAATGSVCGNPFLMPTHRRAPTERMLRMIIRAMFLGDALGAVSESQTAVPSSSKHKSEADRKQGPIPLNTNGDYSPRSAIVRTCQRRADRKS